MEKLNDLEACVDRVIEHCGRELVVGLPLGLGKPVALVNALYARARRDPRLSLTLCTALTLEIPPSGSGLQRRFMAPFIDRVFSGVPELDYARDRRRGALPANVRVLEFYFAPGAMLGNGNAQRDYISSNYTHATRDLLDRGVNVALQMIAERDGRYSLSCNPDLSLDLVPAMRRSGRDCMVVGMNNEYLPFMPNDAEVEPDFFDLVVDTPAGHAPLFPMPSPRIGTAAHAVGLHASTLVRDAGTLQVGIGDLGDAVCHALRLRHTDNPRYRRVLTSLGTASDDRPPGDSGPFHQRLRAASEMFTNGLLALFDSGVLSPAANEGRAALEGAFYLGPEAFYRRLREMPASERATINMTAVSRVNQLYGHECEARAARPEARFINTCIKVTLNGAAASDTLAGGQVLSGVGGQYNFVEMAHALPDGRSILILHSTRTDGQGKTASNIVSEYGQCTIPRHLRDIVVTEYGIANLRGCTDAECADRLIRIADSRFQAGLVRAAKRAGKLPADYRLPASARRNTPESLRQALAPWQADGTLPAFPLGTEFDRDEQWLAAALTHLRERTRNRRARVATGLRALLDGTGDSGMAGPLKRMDLHRTRGPREWLLRRTLCWALKHTGGAMAGQSASK